MINYFKIATEIAYDTCLNCGRHIIKGGCYCSTDCELQHTTWADAKEKEMNDHESTKH